MSISGAQSPAATRPRTARPTPPSKTRRTIGLVVGAVAILACFALIDSRWSRLPSLPGSLVDYIGLMAQGLADNPLANQTIGGYWTSALGLMLESLQMAWLGTLIGAVLSLPLAFLAARNVSPAPVVYATRGVLNALRAVPELILAIVIMLPIFGLGPLSGTLALGVHSIGTLGKLSSEVVESIDSGPVEAVRSSGARFSQILRWGTVPQVMPEIVAFWLYRFEINIRAGAILGVIGAGGIGQLLQSVLSRRLWERAGIMLLVIIVVTIAVDLVSGRLRARIIAGPGGDVTERDELAATPAAANL